MRFTLECEREDDGRWLAEVRPSRQTPMSAGIADRQ